MWNAWHCLSILAFHWGWICGVFCCRFQWAEPWMLAFFIPYWATVCVRLGISPSRPPPLFSAAQWDHVVLLIFQQRPLSLLPRSRFSYFLHLHFIVQASFSSAVVTCFYTFFTLMHYELEQCSYVYLHFHNQFSPLTLLCRKCCSMQLMITLLHVSQTMLIMSCSKPSPDFLLLVILVQVDLNFSHPKNAFAEVLWLF